MPKGLQTFVVFLAAIIAPAVAAPAQADRAGNAKLTLRVEGDGWGRANRDDIEAALRSVADVLTPASEQPLERAIVVSHSDRAPAVLYEHGAAGEYRVLLHARDSEWHLYVYEFAHEYCHILSNYGEYGGDVTRRNQWFEESLCETASLFALKTVAARWQASPPTPRLQGSDKQLHWFFDQLMTETHRRPPEGSFATWLKDSEDELRLDPYQRGKNEVVANRLLVAFGNDSNNWAALRYLNRDPDDKDCSFSEFIEHWYRNARPDERAPVARIRALLFDDAAVASASGTTLR